MIRTVLIGLVATLGASLATGVGLTHAQEAPVALVKVAEVRGLMQQGRRVVLVDVRSALEYVERHIKGAVSVPLNEIEARAGEIPRQGLVVFY